MKLILVVPVRIKLFVREEYIVNVKAESLLPFSAKKYPSDKRGIIIVVYADKNDIGRLYCYLLFV